MQGIPAMLVGYAKELRRAKIDTAKFSFAVVLVVFFSLHCSSTAFAEDCCVDGDYSFNRRRLESALELTKQANRLTEINALLTRWSRWSGVLALTKETPREDAEKGTVEETTARTRLSSENFQKMMFAYQDARRQYLQHKLLYDEHVGEFHRQAQAQSQTQVASSQSGQQSGPAPLVVPALKRLRLKAQDACSTLQQAEGALNQSEGQIASMVNYLASSKGKINANSYMQDWTNAQTQSTFLQRQVVDFGRDVLQKEETTEDQLHSVTQQAQRDGDFVQSRDVYMEIQRRTALNNEETRRAHLHTMFSAMAVSTLNALSPLNQAAPSVPATGIAEYVTSDQIQRESQALQTEYDNLQKQYALVEKSNPAH